MTEADGLPKSSLLAPGIHLQAEIADMTQRSSETGTPPYLPLELKGIVAEFLCKSDLKTLRLVSRQWHAMTTPLLFDQVYVSPRKKDIQVFSHITKHPLLSRSIKKMICDVSTVTDASQEDYFRRLCGQRLAMTRSLSEKDRFNSPHPRFNEFINAIIRAKRFREHLLSKYANDEYVMEGWQVWQDLAKEEREALEHGTDGIYFSDLCYGLHRLSNLQSVIIDDGMWVQFGKYICENLDPSGSQYIPSPSLSGSPLARSWAPWHLRPRRSNDAGFKHLSLTIQALSRTERRVKHFDCRFWVNKGLSPWDFAKYNMTDSLAQPMTIALRQLQTLKLQTTPCRHHDTDHGNISALVYLPQLLEQLADLRCLTLGLTPAEYIDGLRLSVLTSFRGTCYSYSQVFPRHGKWERLEQLHLAGLATDGLDMLFLLLHQMPHLKRLRLRRIDLLRGSWSGVVEALRFRAVRSPWELLSLEGSLRHDGGMWWPCNPDLKEKEAFILGNCMAYAKQGGRHPCLPPDVDESLSRNYFQDLFREDSGSLERVRAFWHRVQSMNDR